MMLGDFLRVFIVVVGIVLLVTTISSLAKRKMTETVCLAWGLVALVFILSGILLKPYGISEYISLAGLVLVMIIGTLVLYGAFIVSTKLSELVRKNHELALQVSLLNHENQIMVKKIEKLEATQEKHEQVE